MLPSGFRNGSLLRQAMSERRSRRPPPVTRRGHSTVAPSGSRSSPRPRDRSESRARSLSWSGASSSNWERRVHPDGGHGCLMRGSTLLASGRSGRGRPPETSEGSRVDLTGQGEALAATANHGSLSTRGRRALETPRGCGGPWWWGGGQLRFAQDQHRSLEYRAG
jgi:hypothetical protein